MAEIQVIKKKALFFFKPTVNIHDEN